MLPAALLLMSVEDLEGRSLPLLEAGYGSPLSDVAEAVTKSVYCVGAAHIVFVAAAVAVAAAAAAAVAVAVAVAVGTVVARVHDATSELLG